jgi:monovalent cation:H+ antiporter-2, CPA2 family
MDFWSVLSGLLVLLGSALAAGIIFERMGQSAVLGYLLAGLLLGPHAFGPESANNATISSIAELGVALLLFAIGLEFSLKRLWRMGPIGLGGGSIQVILTVIIGAGISFSFGLGAQAAIGVGAIVAFSSTACVLRVLNDRGQIDSYHGRNSLGILLLQDLAVIPLVLIISMLDQGNVRFDALLIGMARSAGLFLGMTIGFWLIANYLLPHILRTSALLANRKLLILLAALLSLGSAWVAHSLGISPALGAFVAGMVLAESPYALQARADIGTLRTLFVTVFFVSIGMLGNPQWVYDNMLMVLAAGSAVIAGKIILIALIVRAFRSPWPEAIATAVCLAQIGEFSFIIAERVFNKHPSEQNQWLFNLFVSISIISLLVTPYLVRYAPDIGRMFQRKKNTGHHHADAADGITASDFDRVLVVGYGVAGQQLIAPLARYGAEITVIDFQAANVQLARDHGLHGIVGDARHAELLEHLHVAKKQLVIVALPDHHTVVSVIHQVRFLAPSVPIVARARYHRFAGEITAAGATVVVDEEQQIGLRLGLEARRILRKDDQENDRMNTGTFHRPQTQHSLEMKEKN